MLSTLSYLHGAVYSHQSALCCLLSAIYMMLFTLSYLHGAVYSQLCTWYCLLSAMYHMLWIHLPHYTDKTELAFILKLQIPHGLTLLFNKQSFTGHDFGFVMQTFKLFISNVSFHCRNFFYVNLFNQYNHKKKSKITCTLELIQGINSLFNVDKQKK